MVPRDIDFLVLCILERNAEDFYFSSDFRESDKTERVFKMSENYYQKEIETMSREDMKALQSELTELLKQEEESKKELLEVFKDLGYEIKL